MKGRSVIKESTASAFVFGHDGEQGWRVALVMHPRLGEYLPAGGHVESNESAAEAAVREIGEETGLQARLLAGPGLALPAGFPHTPVIAPWWTVEMAAGADNHTPGPHVHIDHVFVAVADDPDPRLPGEHEIRWFTSTEAAQEPLIAEDSRLQAKELFARIDEIAATAAL